MPKGRNKPFNSSSGSFGITVYAYASLKTPMGKLSQRMGVEKQEKQQNNAMFLVSITQSESSVNRR